MVEPSSNADTFDDGWRTTIGADTRAGLVVFLVALPLCLGVALASGAPLMSGIVTGVVGGVLVSRLSGSQLMVSGPAAGLTAIVAAAILQLGSFRAFLVAVVIAGILQIVLRFLRAGIIAYFFPTSVIRGMLAAIGLILILKQLPYALGASIAPLGTGSAGAAGADAEGGGTLGAIFAAVSNVRPGALVIAFASLALLIAWEHPRFTRARKVVPAPLAVVVLAVLANQLFAATTPAMHLAGGALVNLPAADGWRSMFAFPDWSQLANPAIYGIAVTLALVASLETLLSLEATDKLDPYKRTSSADRELLAQGVGNVAAGMLGGLPMTGVIVRSAANVSAGGRTWRASFFHGLFLATAVATLASVLNLIPLAALAAILIFTGYKLVHPSTIRRAYAMGPAYVIPFAATIIAILATDLLIGIAIGLTIGAFFVLLESYRHAYFYQREESEDHQHVRLHLAEEVSFLNKARINAALNEVPAGCVVTVDGSRSRYIDPDVVEILHEFRDRAVLKNITFRLVGIPNPITLQPSH